MSQLPPDAQILRLANAYQLSRAVQVAAQLELGHRLEDGPRTVDQLAEATETDADVLRRLLRFLAELGVVAELEDGRFAATPLSQHLDLADNLVQGEEAWAAWGALPQALRRGQPSFNDVYRTSFWQHAAAHPEREARWQRWNARQGLALASALAAEPELAEAKRVVDVGGGDGTLLVQLLAHHPQLRGVLLDLPGTVAQATNHLRDAEVMERLTLVAGDARLQVPPGGDLYLLCRVLFNWDDPEAGRILTACRRALGREGRLWIVEPLMPDRGDPARRALAAADLQHFLLWGGKHRTHGEIETLLTASGFGRVQVHRTADGWPRIEARLS